MNRLPVTAWGLCFSLGLLLILVTSDFWRVPTLFFLVLKSWLHFSTAPCLSWCGETIEGLLLTTTLRTVGLVPRPTAPCWLPLFSAWAPLHIGRRWCPHPNLLWARGMACWMKRQKHEDFCQASSNKKGNRYQSWYGAVEHGFVSVVLSRG